MVAKNYLNFYLVCIFYISKIQNNILMKFYRKIRIQMLINNKFSKYILYAIGEILLVVIGILIALYINNKNQEHQLEKRTTILLKEVTKDLEMFISVSNNQLKFYSKKQQIFDLILNNKLSFEDYSNAVYPNLTDATTWYSGGIKRKVAYRNLINEINTIPEKYNLIINGLSDFYENTLNEDYTKLIEETSIENQKKRVNNYEWYALNIPSHKNEKMINFLLNDYRYKNEAKFYFEMVTHHIRFILEDKIKAQKLFKAINETLNIEIEDSNFSINPEKFDFLIGQWENNNYKDFKINVFSEDEKLQYQTNIDTTKFELFPIFKDLFIDKQSLFWRLNKNDTESKISIVNEEFTKVKE